MIGAWRPVQSDRDGVPPPRDWTSRGQHEIAHRPVDGPRGGAGGFAVAALLSAGTAPTARADDFSDTISAVDADFAIGEFALNYALSNFGSNELYALEAFFDGTNEDALSAPDNLLIGTVEALTNETVTGPISWGLGTPSDYAGGVDYAQSDISIW